MTSHRWPLALILGISTSAQAANLAALETTLLTFVEPARAGFEEYGLDVTRIALGDVPAFRLANWVARRELDRLPAVRPNGFVLNGFSVRNLQDASGTPRRDTVTAALGFDGIPFFCQRLAGISSEVRNEWGPALATQCLTETERLLDNVISDDFELVLVTVSGDNYGDHESAALWIRRVQGTEAIRVGFDIVHEI